MLQILKKLFVKLNSSSIAYCHWKSNSHLEAGLSGDTDLDLLVREGQKEEFKEVLIKCGFKHVIPSRLRQYPEVEHYLGFDFDMGKVAHLHVYYKLVLGQRYVKNYRLPIENCMFTDLRLMKEVYVPTVELELLLLLIRASMKLSFRDVLGYLLRRTKMPLPKGLSEEFVWLARNFDNEKFIEALDKSGLALSRARLAEFAQNVKEGTLTLPKVLLVRNHIFTALRPLRRQSSLCALRRAVFVRLSSVALLQHFLQGSKKRLDGRGRTIALVGADGSGKTTTCRALSKCLGRKLWVKRYYLGSGQPTLQSRFLRVLVIPMLVPRRIWSRAYWARLLRHYAHGMIELFNAWDRASRFRKGLRMTSKGCIVFFDRYPILGVADEPVLLKNGNEFKEKAFARWIVRKVYSIYEEVKEPDVLFHLSLAPAIAITRKPEHNREMIAAKEARLEFYSEKMGRSGKAVRVDASATQERVVLDIIKEVWRRL